MIHINRPVVVAGFQASVRRIYGLVLTRYQHGIRIVPGSTERLWAPQEMVGHEYDAACAKLQQYLTNHGVTLVAIRDWDRRPAANASHSTALSREFVRDASQAVCPVMMVRPEECQGALDGLAIAQTAEGHWPRALAVAVHAVRIVCPDFDAVRGEQCQAHAAAGQPGAVAHFDKEACVVTLRRQLGIMGTSA